MNIDSTVVIEKPKLAPYIDNIKAVIADLLECREDQVSVKATTSEKLGFVGLEEGVKAHAVVLITKSEE